MDKLSLRIDGYGEVTVTTSALDAAMSRYLPASPSSLRTICEDRSGLDDLSYIKDVSSFLIMLADWDHNTDGSPLSVDAVR